jgi:hypothetical protein
MKADVAFASRVKMKADRPLPANDLYVSPWFDMAHPYAVGSSAVAPRNHVQARPAHFFNGRPR